MKARLAVRIADSLGFHTGKGVADAGLLEGWRRGRGCMEPGGRQGTKKDMHCDTRACYAIHTPGQQGKQVGFMLETSGRQTQT